MDCKASDVVRVSLEGRDFFVCVVIVNAELEVVRASYEPVFTWDEFDTADRDIWL